LNLFTTPFSFFPRAIFRDFRRHRQGAGSGQPPHATTFPRARAIAHE
jgi:hypothetical protein